MHFTYITSFNIFAASDEEDTIIIILILTGEQTGAKKWGHLPTTTQWINDAAGSSVQAVRQQSSQP